MNAEEAAIWEARWLRATAGNYTTQGEWTRYFDVDSGMPFYCKLLALSTIDRSLARAPRTRVRPLSPHPAPLAHPSPSLARPSTPLARPIRSTRSPLRPTRSSHPVHPLTPSPSSPLAHPSTALPATSLRSRSQGKTLLRRRLGSSRPFPPPPHGWKPRRARGARCGGSSATPHRVASWRVAGSRPGPSSRRRPRGPSLPSLQDILFRRGRQ